MAESIQKKISRVRAPRVHITYDVEVGDEIQKREIAFIVGVMADLSGKPEEPLPDVKDRKFVEIDRDSFDKVLEGMKPRLAFKVDNKLTNDGSVIPVELKFKSLNDFQPERVAEQVAPLNKLLDARKKLFDLMSKLDGNDRLSTLLQEAVAGADSIAKLGEQAGVKKEEENKPAS